MTPQHTCTSRDAVIPKIWGRGLCLDFALTRGGLKTDGRVIADVPAVPCLSVAVPEAPRHTTSQYNANHHGRDAFCSFGKDVAKARARWVGMGGGGGLSHTLRVVLVCTVSTEVLRLGRCVSGGLVS